MLLKGLDLFLFRIFSFMKSCLIPPINQGQIPETDISPIHWGLLWLHNELKFFIKEQNIIYNYLYSRISEDLYETFLCTTICKLNPFDFLVDCATKRSTENVYPYGVIISFVIV